MTHAESFVPSGCFNLGFTNADYRNGFADGVKDLELIAWLLAGRPRVLFHHGGEISLTDPVFRKVLRQDNVAEEFVFHRDEGYKVTKRTSSRKRD